ncbi:hypothetical protein [Nocardioides speluncae]|uniref:hypothetical protein n=1 Tax=Nocardioides speluncae TaxID=2670337 RepID=UPI000D68CBA8|nr:hypothetical protein [Nocardioides speluncae]
MTNRVRQGLGLLAIAALLFLALLLLQGWTNPWKDIVLGAPLFACAAGGLGVLAYGLLRGR